MTDGDSATAAAATPLRRKRTTGFPVVSLGEAADILKTAGKYGFEHSVAAFASYMGHSSTNSGAFRQRIAAFRDWRLITGRGENIAFTDIARVIALPPDPEAERRAMRDAFGSCAVFFKLYDSSAKGTSLQRQGLGNRAVLDLGVAPGSKNRFVDSFVDSAVAARLAEVTDDGGVLLLPSTDGGADQVGPHLEPPLPSPRQTASGSPDSRPVVRQTWNIDGGLIAFEIRSEHPLPSSAFTAVGEAVANLERLAATLASPTSAHSTDPERGAE